MSPLRYALAIACLTILCGAQENTPDPDSAKVSGPTSPEAVAARDLGLRAARSQALKTAHQIGASQGYRQRGTHWSDSLPGDGFTVIPLQLFAGNDYYLVLGSDAAADQISAAAFDPERMLVKASPSRGGRSLVLRITPERSGRHYLRLHLKGAQPKPVHCAVTYLFR